MKLLQNEKLDTLQVLRCFAMLAIVMAHVGYDFPDKISAGAWGVSIFFVLSGFTMIYSYYGQDRIRTISIGRNIAFAYNKIIRLYPIHVVATLVIFVGSFINGTNIYPIKVAVIRLVLNLLLVQEYLPLLDQSICLVSWYLCVAALSYFIFPWILRRMEHEWSVRKSLVMIAASIVLIGGGGTGRCRTDYDP